VELAIFVLEANGPSAFARLLPFCKSYGERKKIDRLADLIAKAADAAPLWNSSARFLARLSVGSRSPLMNPGSE